MPIPETTSAEALERYLSGKRLLNCHGEAWRDIKASIFSLPKASGGGMDAIPSISEPFLIWIMSGEMDVREREIDAPWMTSRVKKGSFFLTTSGSPYECHWKTYSSDFLSYMLVIIELPLMQRAMEEVFGEDAIYAKLQDVSAFTDSALNSLMERLHGELVSRKASPLYVQGIAQSVAVHLARNYTVLVKKTSKNNSSLPGYKLRRVTDWMAEHISEDFNLAQVAAQAGLSKFHFHRLFKSAIGVSPARYHVNLRMDMARQLLRETKKNVIAVALEVGYANPSHFAQIFRKATGLSPSEYRKQR